MNKKYKIVVLGSGILAYNCVEQLSKVYDIVLWLSYEIKNKRYHKFLTYDESLLNKKVNHCYITKETDIEKYVSDFNTDFIFTCSFGHIFTKKFTTENLIYNLHPSILPKYKGPNPLVRTILNGDNETGITIVRTIHSIDSGKIMYQTKINLSEYTSIINLYKIINKWITDNLLISIENILKLKQNDELNIDNTNTVQKTKKNKFGDRIIDFSNKSSYFEFQKFLAYNPITPIYFIFNKIKYFIWDCMYFKKKLDTNKKEKIIINNNTIILNFDNDYIEIYKLQEENRKIITTKDFYNGWINKKK